MCGGALAACTLSPDSQPEVTAQRAGMRVSVQNSLLGDYLTKGVGVLWYSHTPPSTSHKKTPADTKCAFAEAYAEVERLIGVWTTEVEGLLSVAAETIASCEQELMVSHARAAELTAR